MNIGSVDVRDLALAPLRNPQLGTLDFRPGVRDHRNSVMRETHLVNLFAMEVEDAVVESGRCRSLIKVVSVSR